MISFQTLAAKERNAERFFCDADRHIFPAAILEIAHALSRGRKPSSCSLVQGDLRKWLHRMYIEERDDCHDHMGDKCSVADGILDSLYGWGYDDPGSMRLARAIVLCRTLIRPIKKDRDDRGDWRYQDRNKVTNLKQKVRYWRERQGSHYDDAYYAGGMDDFDLLDMEPDGHTDSLQESASREMQEELAAMRAPSSISPVRRVRRVAHNN